MGLAPSLAIDLGVAKFATLVNDKGNAWHHEGLDFACQQLRLKRYQRSVSRKKKGSKNRRKAIDKLGRMHQKLANQRQHFLHYLSTTLTDSYPVIVVEDLRIKNMSASAKGTAEQPGKNVRQKSGLNRSILAQAWGEFIRQLAYKLQWRGGQLVKINPAHTSQRCSCCGHVSADNRPSQAKFLCVACGHTENADQNAAKNILAAGRAAWALLQEIGEKSKACGEDVRRAKPLKAKRAASVKQEPAEGFI